MTPKRQKEKEWEALGLCGKCCSHPPVFKSGKCQKCYETLCRSSKKWREKNRERHLLNVKKSRQRLIKTDLHFRQKEVKRVTEYRRKKKAMKPPIPTPEPVPVQTLRRYGLNATADEVAEVYAQREQALTALKYLLSRASSLDQGATHDGLENCTAIAQAKDLLTRINPTQKKG